MNWLLYLFAIAAGVALPLQSGLNSQMSKHLGHPVYSALLSFLIGSVGLLIYSLVARLPASGLRNYTQAPVWDWLPGLLGAFYVTATVILVPRLGAVVTFGLIISGQMIISVVLDHFGLIGLPVAPLSMGRLLGILLLIAGVLLIRRF